MLLPLLSLGQATHCCCPHAVAQSACQTLIPGHTCRAGSWPSEQCPCNVCQLQAAACSAGAHRLALSPACSSTETLNAEDKFSCDACGCLQEAQKCMKVKELPQVLCLHLKRFKYMGDMHRYARRQFPVSCEHGSRSSQVSSIERSVQCYRPVDMASPAACDQHWHASRLVCKGCSMAMLSPAVPCTGSTHGACTVLQATQADVPRRLPIRAKIVQHSR